MPRPKSCVWTGVCAGATPEICADCAYLNQETLNQVHEEERERRNRDEDEEY